VNESIDGKGAASMKIGLTFFPVRPQFIVPIARHADELGFDSLWLGEHLLFPVKITSKYPYDPTGTLGPPLTTTPLFDPLITFAYIAGQTKKIQMGTSVYIAPLRHPIVVAKLVATLDALSGGRFIFGAGVGWEKEEFDAIGAPARANIINSRKRASSQSPPACPYRS
jgi:alkanesulfonate monooxygenase SsuD/methylene tetrahydromethanopterin reductase-like flavin-dependent oxidoreductase (luciferase family)